MTFRAATYNVYLGADLMKIFSATSTEQLHALAAEVFDDVGRTDFPQRAQGIVAELGRAGWPDLVGCQEVSRWSTGTLGAEPTVWCDFTTELVWAFAEEGAPYDAVASAPNFGGRMPVSATTYVDLRAHNVTFARRDSVTVSDVRGGPFSARLELPTAMAGVSFDVVRSWTIVSAVVGATALQLANTHLETYDGGTRAAQLEELLGLVGPGPSVLLGDFNEEPDSLCTPARWTDAWVVARGADGFTVEEADPLLRNPERHLDRRIDYVLARELSVLDCELIGDRAPMPSGLWPSDHAGVVATLDAGGSGL